MRQFYSFSMILLLWGAGLMAYSQVNLNNGLLIHMPFSGNANDSSGNKKHGTVNNAKLTKDRCGNSNSAYYFNGTDAYIEFPSSTVQTQYYSYSMWVNAEEIPVTGNYTYPLSIGSSGGGQNIAICNNAMQGWSGGAYNNGTPALSLVATGSQAEAGVWYHLVLIRDTNKIKLYVNGKLNTNESTYGAYNTSTGGTTPNYGSSSPKALIGSRDLASQFYFNGSIDDIRIYNRVVNTDEVDSLYHEKMCFFTNIDNVIAGNSQLQIFPNPSNGNFVINIKGNEDNNSNLNIINSIGQVVYSDLISADKLSVEVNNLPTGVYNVVLRQGLKTSIVKISIIN